MNETNHSNLRFFYSIYIVFRSVSLLFYYAALELTVFFRMWRKVDEYKILVPTPKCTHFSSNSRTINIVVCLLISETNNWLRTSIKSIK